MQSWAALVQDGRMRNLSRAMQTEFLHAKQSPRWQVETETVQPWKHWEKDRHEGNFSAAAEIPILASKMFALKGLQPKEMKLSALTQPQKSPANQNGPQTWQKHSWLGYDVPQTWKEAEMVTKPGTKTRCPVGFMWDSYTPPQQRITVTENITVTAQLWNTGKAQEGENEGLAHWK